MKQYKLLLTQGGKAGSRTEFFLHMSCAAGFLNEPELMPQNPDSS